MFKKLINFFKWVLGAKISHTFLLQDSNIVDGDNTLVLMFDSCDVVSRHTLLECTEGKEIYARVSNKASVDDDFVMEFLRNNGVLEFRVGNYQYNFCEEKFGQYFPLETKRLFVKIFS